MKSWIAALVLALLSLAGCRQASVSRQEAASLPLQTPPDYAQVRSLPLAPGVRFIEWTKAGDGQGLKTLRAITLAPEALNRLRVIFSETPGQRLDLENLAADQKMLALTNWVFFGRLPGADMLGENCRQALQDCRRGSFLRRYQSEKQQNDLRYALLIGNDGKLHLLRSGLNPRAAGKYRLFLGGGLLLSDQPESYARNNDPALLAPGMAGDPARQAPRTAIGLPAGGGLVLLNLGEGKNRLAGGVTPVALARLTRQMGLNPTLMFDGGGATVMRIRDHKGKTLVATRPEVTSFSDYRRNVSFLVLSR